MRFVITFSLVATILASSLYGLILAVDPYNKFGYNLFNFKTKAVDFARVNKFNQVEHAKIPYDAFLMGSSSAHRYRTKTINDLTGFTAYNYSTQSGTPEDYISMVRHIFKKHKPKLLILSLDFETLNKHYKTDDMFYASPLKNYLNEAPAAELDRPLLNNTYLTLEAIVDSFKVIMVNLFGEARHAYLEHGDHIVEPIDKELKIKQFSGGPYDIDEKRIEYLKTIKRLADEAQVQVVVLTSPLSYDHIAKIKADPKLAPKNEEFKKAVVDVFGHLWDFHNEGIKHFNSTKYFCDSNHPGHDFSDLILERILGKKEFHEYPGFGELLVKQ
jgi:hypothetical protein